MNDAPTEGDFAYVKRPGRPVREVEVISSGEVYELRLFYNNEVIETFENNVWTTHDSMRVTA